jgi:hypothetical protein
MLVDLIGEYTFKAFVEDLFEMNWSECETQDNKNERKVVRILRSFSSPVKYLLKGSLKLDLMGCATCGLLLLNVLLAASLKKVS